MLTMTGMMGETDAGGGGGREDAEPAAADGPAPEEEEAAAEGGDFLSFCLRWTLACRFFSSERANLRGHWSHEKGFSPVWVRTWVVR